MERSKEYEPLILDLQKSKMVPHSKRYLLLSVIAVVATLGIVATLAALYYPKPTPEERELTPVTPTPRATPTSLPTPTPLITPTPLVMPTPVPAVKKPEPTPPKPAATPTAQPTVDLSAAPGILNLDSIPDKAEVRLGGKVLGQTPLRNFELKPGTYTVKFAYQGKISEQKITIAAGKTTDYTYRFEGFGSLRIQTTRSGSEIFVNGELKGQSPLLVEGLAPGTYTITAQKSGYATAEKTVTLGQGESQDVLITLKPIDLIFEPERRTAPRITPHPERPRERPRNDWGR